MSYTAQFLLVIAIQVIAAIVAFSVWGFAIHDMHPIRFIAGWVLLVTALNLSFWVRYGGKS